MNSVSSTFQPVSTRAALALQRKNKRVEFQATVFDAARKIVKKSPAAVPNENEEQHEKQSKSSKSGKDELEFDIKKARHEILNFAMNNQRVIKNKKKMQIFQAVKLGAKPPKKTYKNYKELVEERKRLKNIREERKKFHQLGKNQTGAASVKCRSKTKLERQKKKRAPVTSIAKHYGVANPNLKKK